jgi:hypothetical protein
MEVKVTVSLTSALDGQIHILTSLFPVGDVHWSTASVISAVMRATVFSAGMLCCWDEDCLQFDGSWLQWCYPLHHIHYKLWGVMSVVAACIFSLWLLMVRGWVWYFRWPWRKISNGMRLWDLGDHLTPLSPVHHLGRTSHSFAPCQQNKVVLHLV